MEKRYVIEYRKVKKNVLTFGLKEWFEAIVLWCVFDESIKQQPEKYKVINNLGKVQSKANMVTVVDDRGYSKTRPGNVYSEIEPLIDSAIKQIKHHYYSNRNSIGNTIPEIILYSKPTGIKQIINLC